MRANNTPHKKFISEFVGELYAILIGIGIANVIFTLDFSLGNWFQIVLALFVTVIVTLYWWDWAAYVEKQFVATPAEFAVDFACLIVLELLFVHFHQPVKLAATFLALGVVDFCWVVNHIRQSPTQTYAIRKWWLAQKVLGLAIYGTGLSVVLWMEQAAGSMQSGTCVILTAVLVRLFCFRGVHHENPLTFRAAKSADITRILAINKAYLDCSRNDSFLLEELSETSLNRLIIEHPERLFVATRGKTILAYAKVDWSIDESILSSLIWLDPQLEIGVRKESLLHIEQVAVDPVHASQGIGKRTYSFLLKQHSELLPCAFVAVRPRYNATSLRFHAALGFEKAAVFRNDGFFGQRNYQSLLYVFSSRLPAKSRAESLLGKRRGMG